MFHYVCLGTDDLARVAPFYDAVLGVLGLRRCNVAGEDGWIGWRTGTDHGAQEVTLWLCRPFDGRPASTGNGTMVALRAADWDQVDAFHAAARAHGGRSEGEPGLRPHYAADFYAAYVRDPAGHKLAAVCRGFTARPAPAAAPATAGEPLPALPAIRTGRYRHYKGGEYEVLGVVRHSETREPLVLYRPLYGDTGSWVRPYAMFLESVEVDGATRPRFAFVDDAGAG